MAGDSTQTQTQTRARLMRNIRMLVLEVAVTIVGVVAVFSFVFGLMRVTDPSMDPYCRDGDLLLFSRMDKTYDAGDVAVFEYNGLLTTGRVVAVGGDTVNIDSQGLIVNGAHQVEPGIFDETTQVADGVTFPLTVPQGAVFVLGDNRDEAVDSRIVGCVPKDQTLGTVIGLFRRRSI